MRKKIILAIIPIIIIVFVMILAKKRNTDVYLSLAGHSPYDRIDMQIDIDNKRVFSDIVLYSAFNPKKINLPIRLGFHQVSVASNSLKIKEDKIIFLFFNQYILIEFYKR